MQIANPIYDVVFKYLLQDSKIAKLMLSTIIGEDIEEVHLRPQEQILEIERRSLTVFRLDFSAKIKLPDGGCKLVLIEIQKAKFAEDIMRFRSYLGEQYRNKENRYIDEATGKAVPLPIISIYFLGRTLSVGEAPVIKVARSYIDLSSNDLINKKDPFIESLTHDSYVIQIPYLKDRRRNELEQLLAVFDQDSATNDRHILNINEEVIPERLKPIFKRLHRATEEQKVRATMDIEDEILEELEDKERTIELKEKLIQEQKLTIGEKDKTIGEKDKMIGEKDKTIGEKDKMIGEKDKTIGEKDKMIDEKDREIAELKAKLAKQ